MSAPKKSSPSSPWPRGTKRSTRRRLKSNPTRCERETNSTCSRYFGRASSPLSGRRLVDSWHHLHSRVAPCGRAARPSGSLRLPRRTCPPPRRLATLFKSEEGRWWCKKKRREKNQRKSQTQRKKERKKKERNNNNNNNNNNNASLVRHLRARGGRRRRKTTTTSRRRRRPTPREKNSVHHTYTPPPSSTGSKSSVKIKIILIKRIASKKNVPSIGTGSPGTLVVSRSCASWAFLFSATRTREVLRK